MKRGVFQAALVVLALSGCGVSSGASTSEDELGGVDEGVVKAKASTLLARALAGGDGGTQVTQAEADAIVAQVKTEAADNRAALIFQAHAAGTARFDGRAYDTVILGARSTSPLSAQALFVDKLAPQTRFVKLTNGTTEVRVGPFLAPITAQSFQFVQLVYRKHGSTGVVDPNWLSLMLQPQSGTFVGNLGKMTGSIEYALHFRDQQDVSQEHWLNNGLYAGHPINYWQTFDRNGQFDRMMEVAAADRFLSATEANALVEQLTWDGSSDLTPSGKARDVLRKLDELRARPGMTEDQSSGVPTGQWLINVASSYLFNQTPPESVHVYRNLLDGRTTVEVWGRGTGTSDFDYDQVDVTYSADDVSNTSYTMTTVQLVGGGRGGVVRMVVPLGTHLDATPLFIRVALHPRGGGSTVYLPTFQYLVGN